MDMKKYMTPELEVVELKYEKPLLDNSNTGGGEDPNSSWDPTPGESDN